MKSKLARLLSCILLTGGLLACGSANQTVRNESTGNIAMPGWVMEQPPLCGVGIQKHRGNVGMSKQGAEDKGRVDLSRQIETKVESMIKQYNQEGGTADGDFSEEQTTSVSKTLSKQTLNGSVPTKAQIADGNYYALVCLNPGALTDAINQMKELGEAQRAALARRAAKAHADLDEAMKNY